MYRQDLRLEAMPVTITDAVDPPAAGCRLGTFALGVPGEAVVRSVMASVNDGYQYLQRLAGLTTHDLWLSRFAQDKGATIATSASAPDATPRTSATGPASSGAEPGASTDATVVASANVPAPAPATIPTRSIAAPSPTAIDAQARAACSDVAVFVQVYDPESYAAATRLRAPWSAIQARFQPIENVQQSAEARGRPNLTPVTEPTIR
jgi:hypothetical protein